MEQVYYCTDTRTELHLDGIRPSPFATPQRLITAEYAPVDDTEIKENSRNREVRATIRKDHPTSLEQETWERKGCKDDMHGIQWRDMHQFREKTFAPLRLDIGPSGPCLYLAARHVRQRH
jgi:hypothetical protein